MPISPRQVRKVLLTAVALALMSAMGSAPGAAATGPCWETEMYGGMYCNDGSLMEVCEVGDGMCTMDCGQGKVETECIDPD